MISSDGKHRFSFFYPELDLNEVAGLGAELIIIDRDLIKRITQIIRLELGESFVLFNERYNSLVTLKTVGKHLIGCEVVSVEKNSALRPKINLAIPFLKRAALEEVVYAAVECGASELTLFSTTKSRDTLGPAERDRIKRIMVSAAEQSKNYGSVLMPVVTRVFNQDFIGSIYDNYDAVIFFDAGGIPLDQLFAERIKKNDANYAIIVGPEGDLTEQEKELLRKNKVTFCRLTPTILRAQQAAIVGLGIFRSMLTK